MTYEEYLKQNPDFLRKIEHKKKGIEENREKESENKKGEINISAKSYSSFTILKFLFFAIGTGLLSMFLGIVTSTGFAAQKIGFLGAMTGSAFMLISAILSIAYVIALGVYIGVNSK